MNRNVFLFILLSSIALSSARGVQQGENLLVGADSTVVVSKALRAGLMSAVIPGAGQLFDKRYLLSGTFLAFEAVSAAVVYNLYRQQDREHNEALLASFVAMHDTSSHVRAAGFEQAGLTDFASKVHRYRMYNALSWLAGGYVFNVLDAVNGQIKGDQESRNPKIAALLAVVPGLGLGQIYNGEYSKAGMAIMGQVSLGMIALNYHRLMIDAEKEYIRLYDNKNNEGNGSLLFNEFSDDWEFKRRTAFHSRNMYLWYALLYYAFWIGDAVIDAHLHDYDKKMDIVPDLQLQNGGALLKLNVNF